MLKKTASLQQVAKMKKRYRQIGLAFLFAGCFALNCSAQGTEREESGKSLVATADEMAPAREIGEENMTPVFGTDLNDGTYSINVESSSPMFRIVECELTVEDGEMTAKMTMSGDGYLRLFMGTGEEAAEAPEEEFLYYEENREGKQVYEVPVEALDMKIDCAAWSKNKEKWYDRTLIFSSAALEEEAWKETALVRAEDLGLEDGMYQIEVTLEGGSGRTTVESPTLAKMDDGKMTAQIVFSSPYYDYVIVDGEKYEMINKEGNSAFEIPVSILDKKIAVTADTVAMSTPHEIEYTLYFDSSSIEKAE